MVTGIMRLATMPADALPEGSPVVADIGLRSGSLSLPSLSHLADTAVAPRLRALPGVADVATFGAGGDTQVGEGPGVVLVVRKSPSASVFAISREVNQALALAAPGLPLVSIDTSLPHADTYLRSALGNLRVALVGAAVLAALALLCLLLQLRLAFTSLFAIALSLVAATAVLDLFGDSFNALVMLGLLLALTLVVTEAVGEAQAVAFSVDAGQGRVLRRIAAACADLRGSLTMAGLAAVLCVGPLLLATGLTASFLRPMAVAFAVAVLVSLAVAVFVTPAVAAVLLTVVPPATHGTPLPRLLAAGYARSAGALVRVPRLAMACAAAGLAAGVAGLVLLPLLHPGQPAFQDRGLIVRLTGRPGMSLTSMDRATTRAGGELAALPAVQDVGATVGVAQAPAPAGAGRGARRSRSGPAPAGELWVTLDQDAGYGQSVGAVRAVAVGLPGISGTVSTNETDRMVGVLAGPEAGLSTNSTAISRAFTGYVVAALIGVLLFGLAVTGSWRLALLAFGSLPVSLAGGVLTVFAIGADGEFAAVAGLIAVFALAVRQAIAVTAREARETADEHRALDDEGADVLGGAAHDLGVILTPAVVTAVVMTPFAAMGNVPGMELLHTAALVIIGGLVTTTLVSLFVLPAVCVWSRPRPGVPVPAGQGPV